jgi:hypothetical protein
LVFLLWWAKGGERDIEGGKEGGREGEGGRTMEGGRGREREIGCECVCVK